MGIRLSNAVKELRSSFPTQRQGDCGVFSFYYAAHLIQQIHGATGLTVLSVDPPRKRYLRLSEVALAAMEPSAQADRVPFSNPALTPRDRHTMKTSIRKFAKDSFQSAQGEIFSAGEMQRVIDRYGYGSRSSATPEADAKRSFIATALRDDHPVLIPYWCDDDGKPCARDKAPGGHWSLIFEESKGNYLYINPWFPPTEIEAPVDLFLASNAAVDGMEYAPVWAKSAKKPSTDGALDIGSKTTKTSYSATTFATLPKDADPKRLRPLRKQTLANVLFEVFATPDQLAAMSG